MAIDDLIDMKQPVPPDVTEDLASVEGHPRRLSILGKTRNLERLKAFTSIEALWVGDVNESQFAEIVPLIDPLYLNFHTMRVADLSALSRLKRLQALEIHSNTRVADISFLSALKGLRLLALSHCPNVRDIGAVGNLRALEILDLSGGFWSTFRPHSLAPLKRLQNLRGLALKSIRVGDQSLEPVAALTGLEAIELSNQFPTREYARLSVALPHLDCPQLRPYFEVAVSGPGPEVMVTGKGKPVLSLPKDRAKLERYVERFEQMQEEFRADA